MNGSPYYEATVSEPKLKACPFCGGEASLFQAGNEGDEDTLVVCATTDCRCSPYAEKEIKKRPSAEIAWNRRAPVLTPERREALEEALPLLDYYASSCPPGFSATAVRITEAYAKAAATLRAWLEEEVG